MSNLIQSRKLPKRWHWARFDEFLCRIERKVIVDDLSFYDCVGVRWYGMGAFVRENLPGLNIMRKQQWLIKAGDIVYNKLFAWKGAFAMADATVDGCIVSDKFPTYQLDETLINPQFLRYYFRTIDVAQQALALSKGGAAISKLTLNPPQFWDLVVPLPPLEEQQRIVARIEELAAKIEEARGLHNQVASPGSLYTSMVVSIIESQKNAWQKGNVSDVILSMDSGWSPQCLDQPVIGNQWGVLKTTSVQWGEFRPRENKCIPEFLLPKPELCVHSGDVLITRAGPRNRVGVVAAVRKDEPHLMIPDKIIRIRPDHSKIIPRFLEVSLSSPLSQEYLIQRKTGLADAQVNISQNIVKAIPVAYPSLSEQQSIITYLDEFQSRIDTLKRVQAEISAELDALLPSILDKAFKGEL